jgi:hypothetical protein
LLIMSPIKIVITGGPCGGKTTGMSALKKILTDDGYDVYTCPEVSTLLLTNGCKFPGCCEPECFVMEKNQVLLEYETQLLSLVIQLQRSFVGIASLSRRQSIVLFDRGTMDVSAYCSPGMWEKVLSKVGETNESLLGSYDLICHLVTAADGAEEFYSLQNNIARYEDSEGARAIDKKLQQCWQTHPGQTVIKNDCNGFESKILIAAQVIKDYMEKCKINTPAAEVKE